MLELYEKKENLFAVLWIVAFEIQRWTSTGKHAIISGK